jgi:hypothetical protein
LDGVLHARLPSGKTALVDPKTRRLMNTGDKLGGADAPYFIANSKSATQEQDRAADPPVCIDFQVMANAPPKIT